MHTRMLAAQVNKLLISTPSFHGVMTLSAGAAQAGTAHAATQMTTEHHLAMRTDRVGDID